jgi:protoporphyrinogen oxidase
LSERNIVILGGGPAGLGAALWLAERGFPAEVLERRELVGGNAASFEVDGVRVDYGSHRLHPATDPEIFQLLQKLLGADLLKRPRHGRIRLNGRWIHFPLKPLDLLTNAPPAFAAGVAMDLARKALPQPAPDPERETFASVLRRGLGKTICREFYFPFARKLWGVDPELLSPIQARRRVSAGSIGKMLRKLTPGAMRDTRPGSPKPYFYYPKRGFGQISDRLRGAAETAGARVTLDTAVERLTVLPGGGFDVTVRNGSGLGRRSAPRVWSTIPSPLLVRMMSPEAPADVVQAARSLDLRAMVLVYVTLGRPRYTEYDAHYFPGLDVPFTRLSEPKNYADVTEPADRTVLCAEIPCSRDDDIWTLDDGALGKIVVNGLKAAGLPAPQDVRSVVARRLGQAYPIYHRGYEAHFDKVDGWLQTVPGLLSFGRQGLFAHDNTHHTLHMARSAVHCLRDDGTFDETEWRRFREIFEAHVVED